MLSLAEKNLSEIKIVNDQIGNPTSTSAVTYLIKDLLRTDYKGVVHGTCEGSATWYDFAKTIFEFVWITPESGSVYIERICAALLPGRAILGWRKGSFKCWG